MEHITIGILAHVDAGKTTLSESILYLTGKIRSLGRVDHKDAFLDTHELERNRGITIFSKQAVFPLENRQITLLDTPGHVDFSAEMERTLQVLDYAILVINGADGIQGHTKTLWSLLGRYQIPVFLFVNKMDQPGTDARKLLKELQQGLDDGIVSFDEQKDCYSSENSYPCTVTKDFYENVAMAEEAAMEEYLETDKLETSTIARLIRTRKIYPCYFGSALKVTGVSELLSGLSLYMTATADPHAPFGARVYKISRDERGNRLTHMKITSGILRVKDILKNGGDADEELEEKVNQIRIYSGEKFEAVQEAEAGSVCAVTGLSATRPGEGLGTQKQSLEPVLAPVLTYQVLLPQDCDVSAMLKNLRQLEEEDPMLHIVWNEELAEIHVCLMGEVQIEILHDLILERFGVDVAFGEGNIVYKETIKNRVEGVGHYEPLRHYAEVHLILEPGEEGSGLTFATTCSEDLLDRNWQRLILTHLMEKEHRGVLTGAPITDMKITLAAGKAHLKHTEGGDFRQATYRAVRQGLMQAESLLLEPYYAFQLEIPSFATGRALNDMQQLAAQSQPPLQEEDRTRIEGLAPVATMRDYQKEVAAYSRGEGRLSCVFYGYLPCHNQEEIIAREGYQPQQDTENPTGSIFCSHGAGFYVPWDQVPDHMHLESQLKKNEKNEAAKKPALRSSLPSVSSSQEEEKELEEIFIRTYGKIEHRFSDTPRTVSSPSRKPARQEPVTEYLLVDGYNVIFAWEELNELAKDNIDAARGRLMDILCNYQGYKKDTVILVFDAYNIEGPYLEIQKYHNIHVVFTKEAETADQYIEKVVHEIGRKYHVTVVTSDGVEQVVTTGQGADLISSREFLEEIERMKTELREEYLEQNTGGKNYLFDHADKKLANEMEDLRLGRKQPETGTNVHPDRSRRDKKAGAHPDNPPIQKGSQAHPDRNHRDSKRRSGEKPAGKRTGKKSTP